MTKPITFVLFGATGDLARLKILPALLQLIHQGKEIKLIATGRREYSTAEYLDYLHTVESHPLEDDLAVLQPEYVSLNFDTECGFDNLWQVLKSQPESEVLFYMSVGPDVLESCITRFGDDLSEELIEMLCPRIIVEKPFGRSLAEARRLNQTLGAIFGDENIFRNDHYLFKNSIQALQRIRLEDAHIAELLNGESLREVKLVVSERVDLGTRAGYFEGVGILVDWFQSHMLQILAIVCSHPAESSHAGGTGQANFIDSLQPRADSIIRAQYEGYTASDGVALDSQTETFLALKLRSDLPRWSGTDFSLVCGKALAHKEVFLELVKHDDTSIKLSFDPPGGHPGLAHVVNNDDFTEPISLAINGDTRPFISQGEIEVQWELTEKVKGMMENVPMQTYDKETSYTVFCNDKWC